MANLRVLALHPALAPYRVDMFNALGRRCDLEVLFLSEQVGNQAFDQARLRAGLDVPHGYLVGGLTLAGRTLRPGISRAIRRARPDVVVTSEFGQTTLAAAAARRAAGYAHVVATEDNPVSVTRDTFLHGLGRRVLLPAIDAVVTYSEESAALYRERFGAVQPVVASPLIQDERRLASRLGEAGPDAAALADAHGLRGRKVLLYVGRLAPEKRVDRLVDAVGRLAAELRELTLVLVGDGPERTRLEARAAAVAPGRVVFAGRQEGRALFAWYRLGGVFALASSHEPFGAVVNEALAAGLPAVCSDRAGARALVIPGRNGEVVDAGMPGSLDPALATWLAAAPPIPSFGAPSLHPSRMISTFDEAVERWMDAMGRARAWRASPVRRAA